MKINFKKLFVSILACISVVPSANFKAAGIAEPSEIVNINTAQDWIDISNRIERNMHYTRGKYFRLNNDIVLNAPDAQHHTEWSHFLGTLDGNNHTITVNGDGMGCLILYIYQSGIVTNVRFSNFSGLIGSNYGMIDNCEFTGTNNHGRLVMDNARGIIRNCRFTADLIAGGNSGTIENCTLFIDDSRRAELQLGEPDGHVGSDDVWNSARAQRCIVIGNDDGNAPGHRINGTIQNCQIIHQNP